MGFEAKSGDTDCRIETIPICAFADLFTVTSWKLYPQSQSKVWRFAIVQFGFFSRCMSQTYNRLAFLNTVVPSCWTMAEYAPHTTSLLR